MIDLIRSYFAHGAPCLFHLLTGYYCPGCGGTRAVRFLLHGDLLRSFIYHPLVLYTAVIFLYVILRLIFDKITAGKYLPRFRFRPSYLWIALVIVGVNFAVKNIALYFGVDLLAL